MNKRKMLVGRLAMTLLALGLSACTTVTTKNPSSISLSNKRSAIHLEPAISSRSLMSFCYPFQDDSKQWSFPFAVPSGKLLFKFIDKTVFVDRNYDGLVDAADGEGAGNGEMLTIPITVMGKPIDYAFKIKIFSETRVYMHVVTVLKGRIAGHDITLYDYNHNGRFNEMSIDQVICKKGITPLSSLISLGDAIYQLGFDEESSGLQYSSYDGDVAELTVKGRTPEWKVFLNLDRIGGPLSFSARAGSSCKSTLIPGDYIATLFIHTSQGGLKGTSVFELSLDKGENEYTLNSDFKLEMKASKDAVPAKEITIDSVVLSNADGIKFGTRIYKDKLNKVERYVAAGEKRGPLALMEYG